MASPDMVNTPSWIVCKLSGEFLALTNPDTALRIRALAEDIIALRGQYRCALVIGGGNIIRGSSLSKLLGVNTRASHYAGMVATLVNGIVLSDLLAQAGCSSRLMSALSCPSVAEETGYRAIEELAENTDVTPIFAGGIATPYVTTDTTAVIRALQLDARAVIKLTSVDGVYSDDPKKNPHAQRMARVSYAEYLLQRLGVIDETAVSLARDHQLPILVARHEAERPLRRILDNPTGASIITDKDIVW